MFVQFLPLFLFSLFIISGTYFTVNISNQFKFQYINIYQSVSWSNICKLKYTITYFNFFKKKNVSLADTLHAAFLQ